ncbi:MAG: hypothetical protein HC809_10210 [Gammaproteobacteria bacterium]|nr:hypothetical protein [Gammaproteobacteria bacterium]
MDNLIGTDKAPVAVTARMQQSILRWLHETSDVIPWEADRDFRASHTVNTHLSRRDRTE